jgi:hypothetical protein
VSRPRCSHQGCGSLIGGCPCSRMHRHTTRALLHPTVNALALPGVNSAAAFTSYMLVASSLKIVFRYKHRVSFHSSSDVTHFIVARVTALYVLSTSTCRCRCMFVSPTRQLPTGSRFMAMPRSSLSCTLPNCEVDESLFGLSCIHPLQLHPLRIE